MEIKIAYRRKKSGISMTATNDGGISVSAPIGMSRAAVLSFVEQHLDWIDSALARKAEALSRRRGFFGQLDVGNADKRAAAAGRLEAVVAPLLLKHQARMGVEAKCVAYTCAKSRWGSCNTRTRRISLSLYLLLLPGWCIEHVVVHELAHLLVPNHGPMFYAVMDEHFPRWREARNETNRICRSGNAHDGDARQ